MRLKVLAGLITLTVAGFGIMTVARGQFPGGVNYKCLPFPMPPTECLCWTTMFPWDRCEKGVDAGGYPKTVSCQPFIVQQPDPPVDPPLPPSFCVGSQTPDAADCEIIWNCTVTGCQCYQWMMCDYSNCIPTTKGSCNKKYGYCTPVGP